MIAKELANSSTSKVKSSIATWFLFNFLSIFQLFVAWQ
jgi:hypothetical protein